jgi:hypothetical protein
MAVTRHLPHWPGRIAQLVEQLTLNQRVPGSSPGAPTNTINDLGWYYKITPTECSAVVPTKHPALLFRDARKGGMAGVAIPHLIALFTT